MSGEAPEDASSVAASVELGRAARRATPRSSHADWASPDGRPDPVARLEAQNETRVPWLVPVRHARMQVSPFTFYRGAAAIMAADLAGTPTSGLTVQLGGDAHLSNFGAYASPDVGSSFDQTTSTRRCPGPWEWDVKRLAASFVVAAQFTRALPPRRADRATRQAVRSYRESMAGFAELGYLVALVRLRHVDDSGADGRVSPEELDKRLARFQQASHAARPASRRWRSWPRPSTVDGRSATTRRCCSRCGELPFEHDAGRAGGGGPRGARDLQVDPRRQSALRCSTATGSWTSASRSSVWAASAPGASSSSFKGGTSTTRSSSRPRRRRRRSWRSTSAPAPTRTTGDASSRASAWCRRSPTSSSGGPRAGSSTATSTCASSATGRDRWRSRRGVTPRTADLLRRSLRSDPGAGARPIG